MDSDAAAILADARRLVVLTGAGVSTESGVPDFRSPGGVWSRFDPSDFEYDRFIDDPAGFWALRAKLMTELSLDSVKPNAAHLALAAASSNQRYLGHVTQNIDGLFHTASHHVGKVVEMHGSARTVRCIDCAAFFPHAVAAAAVEAGILPPRCDSCGGPLKPGTVIFGEMLPQDALEQAIEWAQHSDTMLVIGSSLLVHPVAALPSVALARGARLIIVNEGPTPYDDEAHALIRGKAGRIVPELLARAGF